MNATTGRTRPYGNLNDLTVDQVDAQIKNRMRIIAGLLTGEIPTTSTVLTVEQDIAVQRETLAGYVDLLHAHALKINPRGVVTEIAAGPDGIRTRIAGGLTPEESYEDISMF